MQGEYVIFVGEGECGCTADDAFFELMEVGCMQYLAELWGGLTMTVQEEWHLVETVDIPRWPEIHDSVQIYRRGST